MFPHFKNIRQFTEDEIKIYDEVMPIVEKNQRLNREEKTIVNALYKSVFGQNPQWKSCSPCNKQIIDNLKKVYEKSCKI
jgi:predicted aldo/keto reductase-like oxidoreductase